MLSFSETLGEYGVRPLYRNLGYFSLIGLLRVHVLLGDFTLALKAVDNVELTQKVRVCAPTRLEIDTNTSPNDSHFSLA